MPSSLANASRRELISGAISVFPVSFLYRPKLSLKEPTAFDSPTTFAVASVIPGWTAALQLMRAGERWMLYIPWQSAYGSSGNNDGTIPGYTALTFDLLLERIVE